MGTIKITGNGNIVIGDMSGGNIVSMNGKVMVDGKTVFDSVQTEPLKVEITVDGNIENLKADGSVTVTAGKVGTVDAGGSVKCNDVEKNVDAGGSVTANNIGGNVDAGGSVTTKSVGGNIDAGGSVRITS